MDRLTDEEGANIIFRTDDSVSPLHCNGRVHSVFSLNVDSVINPFKDLYVEEWQKPRHQVLWLPRQ